MLFVATAIADQESQENDADAEFLEFLAEVDEATGDGFEQWLEEREEIGSCKQLDQQITLTCKNINNTMQNIK